MNPKPFDQDNPGNVIPLAPSMRGALEGKGIKIPDAPPYPARQNITLVAVPIPGRAQQEYDKWVACANCGEVSEYVVIRARDNRMTHTPQGPVAEYQCAKCVDEACEFSL